MRKKLNTDGIVNELAGASLFFTRPKVKDTPLSQDPVIQQEHQTRDTNPVPPVRVVPPVPPKRVMKQRQPFDIYHDQYDALRQLALEERKQGGIGSMSAMVRQAIDKLIAERRAK